MPIVVKLEDRLHERRMTLTELAERVDLTIVGIGGGTLPVSFFSMPYEVTLSTTYWGTIPELHELIALAARGDIAPVVQRYPLEKAMDAYHAMQDGTLEGRAVIVHG